MAQDKVVEQWGVDRLFFTEAGRGGPLNWRRGSDRLEGDALGPTRHAHDDAAEYYFLFNGAAHIEVSGTEFVLREGELLYIPPDAPHNFLAPAADEDVCLFCVVGPNFANNKWRIEDFRPGSESLSHSVARVFSDESLPAGGTLSAEGLVMSRDDAQLEATPSGCESLYLVVDGTLDVALHGGLGGTIERGTYLHVREGVSHSLSTRNSCKVLRMDCAFAMWANVALPAGAER